jgi:prepilin-type processing-associated H-X9-DG protein
LNAILVGSTITVAPEPMYPLGRKYIDKANKTTVVMTPGPANVFVSVDEHPDSINDAVFHVVPGMTPGQYVWRDLPASYHNGACGFSFADGHSEIKKWKDSRTLQPVHMVSKWWSTGNLPARDSVDIAWIVDRMPWTQQ